MQDNDNRSQHDEFLEFLKQYRLTVKPPLTSTTLPQFSNKVNNEILPMLQAILTSPEIQKVTANKLLLYGWQICNLLVVSSISELSDQMLQKFDVLVQITVGQKRTGNAVKCMYICFFNLVKNGHIQASQIQRNQSSLSRIFTWIFSTQSNQGTEEQMEWLIYLFQQCNQNCEGFLKTLCRGQSQNFTSNIVHFVSLLLSKVIEQRNTTELVRGYSCSIPEIRQMYNKQSKAISYKISWMDYEWLICCLWPESLACWKLQLKNLCESSGHQYNNIHIESVESMIGIFNCCLFLGGYNKHLQLQTTKMMMPTLLEYFQISYLIYELSYSKQKPQKVTLNFHFQNNIAKLLSLEDKQSPRKIDLPLHPGQLVSIVRLMSNLVHINPQAQQYFQQNMQYFRIVMSLTHEHETQATLKQWAIVFLRNVAERSHLLRTQMQKLKIDIKVVPTEPLI